jgi:hypothetical protein
MQATRIPSTATATAAALTGNVRAMLHRCEGERLSTWSSQACNYEADAYVVAHLTWEFGLTRRATAALRWSSSQVRSSRGAAASPV